MRTAHGDGELVKESHGRREGCGSVRKKKSSSWYELNNGNREEKKKEEESKCCGLWIMVSRCGGGINYGLRGETRVFIWGSRVGRVPRAIPPRGVRWLGQSIRAEKL